MRKRRAERAHRSGWTPFSHRLVELLGLRSWLPRRTVLVNLCWACSRVAPRPRAHRGFGLRVAHGFLEGLPTMVFLVAVAALLHHFHWFPGITAQTMRWVHRIENRGLADAIVSVLPVGLRPNVPQWLKGELFAPGWAARNLPNELSRMSVTILQVTPEGYDNLFCGLSPIPRGRLADLLETLRRRPRAGPLRSEQGGQTRCWH